MTDLTYKHGWHHSSETIRDIDHWMGFELRVMPDISGRIGKLIRKYPRLFRFTSQRRVGRDSLDLYQVAAKSSGARELPDTTGSVA